MTAWAPPTPPTTRPLIRQRSNWVRLGIPLGVGALAVIALAGTAATKKDDTPTRTPVEAACQLLNQGETPDQTYGIMKDLLRGHEYTFSDIPAAARLSVDRAVEQGCGR